MHNNYYFLRQLTRQLQSILKGFLIGKIYSQQKNELTISLYNGNEEFYIKAHLDSEFSCLSFPDKISRAKRNSVDLFKSIYELPIHEVVQVDNDRSFYFQLDGGFKLFFKMHGNRANIVQVHDEKVIEVFRNNLKQDHDLQIASMSKKIDTSFLNFEKQNGNYKLVCPTFGKAFDRYFLERDYGNQSIEDKYQSFTALLKYLESPQYYLHLHQIEKPLLSLYQVCSDETISSDPIIALNNLYKAFIGDYLLQKEKGKMRHALLSQIRSGEMYIKKSRSKLNKLISAESYSNIGDLIMANMHLIKPHLSEVTLTDFYTQKPVVIKLKTNLSPQLNAQKYYKKSKKQQIEIANLEKNIEEKEQQITELKDQIQGLEGVKKLKQLRREKSLIQPRPEKPYHVVSFMNFEILIGKNARKNDALTFGIAAKDDLFLHAKDSPGSHVIIRHKTNQNFPRLVIEKAASYAAFYSKSKSESLIRVLYAPKKHVRKAKGSPAGTVIVTNEKVLLVKPEELKK